MSDQGEPAPTRVYTQNDVSGYQEDRTRVRISRVVKSEVREVTGTYIEHDEESISIAVMVRSYTEALVRIPFASIVHMEKVD